MLTKDLLRFKHYKNQIKPIFIDIANEEYLNIAEQLIFLFNNSLDKTVEDIENEAENIIKCYGKEKQIVDGFFKLLMDKVVFNEDELEDKQEFRKSIFEYTSSLFMSDDFCADNVLNKIANYVNMSENELSAVLYSDLPHLAKVLEIPKYTAIKLLHRYNSAQIQGLLIYSQNINLEIMVNDSYEARLLFRGIKFHQLMAKIENKNNNCYHITIDGPLHIFCNSRKYAINLANFFPYLLHFTNWKLSANIDIKHKSNILSITSDCGINSHYAKQSLFIPEEIEMFEKKFRQIIHNWKISENIELFCFEGGIYCIPDFVFINSSDYKIYLEIFYPWHSQYIIQRLEQIKAEKRTDIILAISKKMTKDVLNAVKVFYENNVNFKSIYFREMIIADDFIALLERL